MLDSMACKSCCVCWLCSGVGYERLAWQTLRGMHLVLYAAPRFRKQVLGVKGSAVATGVGNLVGNKVCI